MDAPPSQLLDCAYNDNAGLRDNFSFETDHEALRENKDYTSLLYCLARLEAQRARAVSDHSVLLRAKKEALRNPKRFVNSLRSEQSQEWKLVRAQTIVGAQQIVDLSKYRSDESKADSVNVVRKESNVESKRVATTSSGSASQSGWSRQEQMRLEQLLVEFPSEPVEMERWKKIANALGTRTHLQVQSRTQKYFSKLMKAGLPVPGRVSKNQLRSFKGPRQRSKRRGPKNALDEMRSSTFFPQWEQSDMAMDSLSEDEEDVDEQNEMCRTPVLNDAYYILDEDVSSEEGFDKDSGLYNQLMWTKRLRREKVYEEEKGSMIHEGFSCDGCGVKPIVGGRFQCIECRIPDTIDFCCDCAPKGLKVGKHKRNHQLRPVRQKEKS